MVKQQKSLPQGRLFCWQGWQSLKIIFEELETALKVDASEIRELLGTQEYRDSQ